MEKKIAHELIFEVSGFSDAKHWIYRAIRAGIIRCGQCGNPATHVFWQDQAEWYCRCNDHREDGEQWTGSTHWNPQSFGLYAVSEQAARNWRDSLTPDEQALISIESADVTDYYSLIRRDVAGNPIVARHYLVGDEHSARPEWVDIFPLTNGEFVYQCGAHWGYHLRTYGIYGAWETEALALDAAKVDRNR